MSIKIGIMQGRLSNSINNTIQAFPEKSWSKEFEIGQRINLNSIEWKPENAKKSVNVTIDTQDVRPNPTTVETASCPNTGSNKLEIKIGEEEKFKNLSIKALKCKNSEFDDNPEITAYIQVKDLTDENNNEVFVFNGWMFSSSPSITPFDHPVYDVWLIKCY